MRHQRARRYRPIERVCRSSQAQEGYGDRIQHVGLLRNCASAKLVTFMSGQVRSPRPLTDLTGVEVVF